MIAKAKACKGGGTLFNYVINDEKGYELDRNLISGETSKEIHEDFSIYLDQNQRAQNKLFSIVLSPSIEDSQKLTDLELREMTRKLLNDLDINPKIQPYIAFVHTEKKHKHIHILASRVKADGKLISDHHIGKKAQNSAHNIAIENNLVSAKNVMIEQIKENEKLAEEKVKLFTTIKDEIYQKHLSVMKTRPIYFENYQSKMLKQGISIQKTINKQGLVQGHRFIDLKTNQSFKASEIHRKMGLKNLLESGLAFKNDIPLNPSLSIAQNIGIKIIKRILKQTINQSLGY